MRSRMRQRPIGQSERLRAQLLLQEYRDLTIDNRALVRGQHNIGVIGVLLMLGVVTAALQFDRPEVALAVPGVLVFLASGYHAQSTTMLYNREHLKHLESRINALCPDDGSPPLTWNTRCTHAGLGMNPGASPIGRWLVLIDIVLIAAYVLAVVAGTSIALNRLPAVPEPFEFVRSGPGRGVTAGLFGAVHLALGAWITWGLAGRQRRIQAAYETARRGQTPL